MKIRNKLLFTALSVGLLTGCESVNNMNNAQTYSAWGTIIGATLGYGLGKGHADKDMAIASGALIGYLFGNSVGASLDEKDKQLMDANLHRSLEMSPNGQTLPWANAETGNSGYTTPSNVFRQPSGVYCREFQTEVNVAGELQKGYGTACRQSDGSWKIVG